MLLHVWFLSQRKVILVFMDDGIGRSSRRPCDEQRCARSKSGDDEAFVGCAIDVACFIGTSFLPSPLVSLDLGIDVSLV